MSSFLASSRSSAPRLITLALLAGLAACSTATPPPPAATKAEVDAQCKTRTSSDSFDLIDRHRAWKDALIARDVDALRDIYDESPVHVEGTMQNVAQAVRFRERVIAHLLQKLDGQQVQFASYGVGGPSCDTAISIFNLTLTDAKGNSREVTYMLTWSRVGRAWKLQAEYFGQAL